MRFHKRKIETQTKLLNTQQQAAAKHEMEIKEAETRRKELEKQKKKLEKELEAASSDSSLNLSEAQVTEYYTLQKEAGRKTAVLQAELDDLKRDYHMDQQNLKHETQR